MKKTFITIFSFLYLVSSMGFGSVQHYCQTMQKMMQANENECCCAEIAESSRTCNLPEEPVGTSCCDGSAMPTQEKTLEMAFRVQCCNVQHNYNQLDSSSLPMSIDVNYYVEESIDDAYQTDQPAFFYDFANQIAANPFTHHNLPLLI